VTQSGVFHILFEVFEFLCSKCQLFENAQLLDRRGVELFDIEHATELFFSVDLEVLGNHVHRHGLHCCLTEFRDRLVLSVAAVAAVLRYAELVIVIFKNGFGSLAKSDLLVDSKSDSVEQLDSRTRVYESGLMQQEAEHVLVNLSVALFHADCHPLENVSQLLVVFSSFKL